MTKPFLKWAGGKRQLLKIFQTLLPKPLLEGRVERYAEPFLGGGALFFHLAETGIQFRHSLLCDANPELILVYRAVQKKVTGLIAKLSQLETDYLKLSPAARKRFFLKQRESFNQDRKGFSFRVLNDDALRRASQFLFLNRTGYNGLWRVNRDGEFNVPFGRYAQPRICDSETLQWACEAFKNLRAEIVTSDFTRVRELASPQTFIYYDPPYRPVSSSANFNTYTAHGFNDSEQTRLGAFYAEMHAHGTLQMLSNSESKDHFFQKLYAQKDWRIVPVSARRAINSKGGSRGSVSEIVVVNYPLSP